jgi:Nucleoside-diphosphate-sugar epimerases
LIEYNYEEPIRVIVRSSSDTTQLDKCGLNVEKAVGDLNDRDFIDKCMQNVDMVMHIYNIRYSPEIVKAAIKYNVKRVILVHTTGVYSKHKNASREYIDIENKVIDIAKEKTNNGLNITILRPTMIYGDLCDSNISKFIWMLDRSRIMPVIDHGNSLLQPVNARDLGKAFYKVLISPDATSGKAYDLSGERPIKLIEVFQLIAEGLDKKVVFINIPLNLGVFLVKSFESRFIGQARLYRKGSKDGGR